MQTQQSFYNADVLQKNLYMEAHVPNEQDYFYRAVNVARGATESAAFAGSNTLFSRKALEDAGGLATYSITEDLATSIEILEQGYTSMAVAKELAHGLSPEDADSFIKQRKRWSRGSGEVIPKKRFIFSKLSLKTKWSFGVSYFYWWTFIKRFIYIICPILCGILGFSVAKADLSTLLTIWLPYYVIYNLGIKVMSDGTNSALWSSINDMIQFPYLIFPIIAGTLNIAETKFWVTPKDRVKGRNSSLRLAIPHIVLLILSIITIVLCIYRLLNSHHDGSLIILFWSVVNSYFLLNAIVYYYGRVIDADYDYIETDLVVTMYDEEREIRGKTEMISEKRLFVLLDSDTALDDNRIYFLVTRYKKYQARLAVKVISETARDTKKSYGLEIVGISEHDKAEYWQIIYDRDHPFSRDVNVGIIKNIEILVDNVFSSNEEKRV